MNAYSGPDSALSATPNSGAAPLVVTFTGRGSGDMEGVMRLDYGDGQADESISPIRGFTRSHTYSQPGSYTVKLMSGAYAGQQPPTLSVLHCVEITVH